MEGKKPSSANWGTEPKEEEGLLHTEKNGEIIREKVTSLKGNYMEYYDGIYEAIRNNKSVPVSGNEGMNVIKVIEAALKSNSENKRIDL